MKYTEIRIYFSEIRSENHRDIELNTQRYGFISQRYPGKNQSFPAQTIKKNCKSDMKSNLQFLLKSLSQSILILESTPRDYFKPRLTSVAFKSITYLRYCVLLRMLCMYFKSLMTALSIIAARSSLDAEAAFIMSAVKFL